MKSSTYEQIDHLCATTLRMMSIDAVQQANSGHPGLPLGTADIATVLWTRFLKHNPNDPFWPDRDRFVLSAGHGSALLYSLLHLSGYPLSLDEVKNFRQWGSHTAGHPEYDVHLGIEITTGPLGQGVSTAVGMALAERWLAAHFNRPEFPIVDHYTYVLASDGDLMEGVSHESCALAGHFGLNKLIVFWDNNHISIDGATELSRSTDVLVRFASYGWQTLSADGHDMAAIDEAIRTAQAETERPTIIACRTHIGYGSPRQDTPKAHGEPLGDDGVAATKAHFGWPLEPRFYVPAEVQIHFDQVKATGQAEQNGWENLMAAYQEAHPELATEWEAFVKGELPVGWEAALPDFSGQKALATRVTSGQVLDALVPIIPTLLGGSADLTGSNKTKAAGTVDIQRDNYGGSYLHYGIREHGMGTVMNGLALHGLRPFGGTFLIFANHMYPAIRQAAMMNIPVTYVFTHDSIGLGEDGPTHQPIETLTSLRSIPNLVTLRPADGNETSQAWKVALERRGPTALALTRQGLPQITSVDNGTAQGAYILADAAGNPDVILIATGSEVAIALEAKEILAQEGLAARVVSMPSWELFDAQTADYRQAVLPTDVPKLSVEAGSTLAWSRYADAAVGIDHYGASAPYKTIYKEFGITAENVAVQAKALIGK